jgi:hypothetical protein
MPPTSGTRAHLALAYYYYPNSACTASSRQLDSSFVSSANGGSVVASQTAARTGTNIPFVAADNAAKDRTIKRRD